MKLLIVRLSAIGDVVHTLPALELLRAALPKAELTWVVESFAAPLLEGHPALDRVVVLDRRGATRSLSGLRTIARGVRALRRERFDAAIDFQGLARSALVARASGAERVMGPAWAREGARFLYHERLGVPRPDEAHAVVRYGEIVRAALRRLGCAPPEGPLPPGRLSVARGEGGDSLVLLPGAGKPANRPPPELLAAVADRCVAADPDLDVVLLGGPEDRARAAGIQGRCTVARPRSVCGDVDLLGAARVLAGAAVVVGGDTGPLHMARLLGCSVVALFHAAEPARTGPAGIPGAAPVRVLEGRAPCAPCRARECRRPGRVRICLDGFGAERVADLVTDLL